MNELHNAVHARQLNRYEFKSAYRKYRTELNRASDHDSDTQDWLESINPLCGFDVSSSVLDLRDVYHFSKPSNRHGQYGWENMGFRII